MSAEWKFLVNLNRELRRLRDPLQIQQLVLRLLGEHLDASRVNFARIDGEEFIIRESYVRGVGPFSGRGQLVRFGGAIVDTCRRGDISIVHDVVTDPRFSDQERERLLVSDIAAFVAAPLIKEGQWVATLGVHDVKPRTWGEDHVALIEVAAERMWRACERTSIANGQSRIPTQDEIAPAQRVAERTWAAPEQRKAEADLRANEERLAFLLRLNDALRPLGDPIDVQHTAAKLLGEHLNATRVGYSELDAGRQVIHREYVRGVPPIAGRSAGLTVGPVLIDALQRGEAIVVHDIEADPRLNEEHRATLRPRQIAALIGVALFKQGRMVATFGTNHNEPRVWTPAEVQLIQDVAARTWDAVERTRAESAIRKNEHRLRLALDASAGGSWTWDAATNQVDWDERFRSLYGFTPDEPATVDKWLPRVHEDDRPHALELLQEMMTIPTKDSYENTFRIVRPDGTMMWMQSRGRAERDATGKLTRLTGLDLDFSQHRLMEEALQMQREEEHNRALRALLETATQGIVSVDAQGSIVTANPAFEAMFGWAPGELIGLPLERLLPSAFREVHARHRTKYFAAPHARLMGGGIHLVGERKDGSTFPIEVSLNHVATTGGGRAFAFVTDITERQRAASALQERTAELEYRTTLLSRMASDLTLAERRTREQIASTLHDGLQQLLVIAALNLEQELKRESVTPGVPNKVLVETKHHLDEAITAARSLSLELFPPVLQNSGLPAALKWLARWTHDKYKLTVRVVADPRADSARRDVRTLLFESVRELLFNTAKHAQSDRVTVELTLDDKDRLCITVSDRGVGFDPARLDTRSKTSQIGWGLFSIRERVTLLGGRVEIDSAPGHGTRVRLVAPRGTSPANTTDSNTVSLAPIAVPAATDASPDTPDALRILIVDDHAAVRSALRQLLQERPQLTVVGDAANGFEAIAHAHRLRPHVILMDVAMPHMDGVEATARIRAELPAIQILGLSMQPRTETAHAIEQAGAAGFFVKGTDTQRLIDHLLVFHASRHVGERADL